MNEEEKSGSFVSTGKKEISLYKYVKFDVLKDIIKNWSLKITSPLELNDPFECLSRGETEQDPSLKDIKFLCLSETNDSHVMWAHYAEKHTGACLEFALNVSTRDYINPDESKAFELLDIIDIQDESDPHYREKSLLHKVIYNNEYPDSEKINEDIVLTVTKNLTTKSPEWEYEKEYRSFFFDKEPNEGEHTCTEHLMPYLKRIILGVRTTDEKLEEIRSLLERHNHSSVPITKASIHPNGYKVLIEPSTQPSPNL